jgi:hypothetical protein
LTEGDLDKIRSNKGIPRRDALRGSGKEEEEKKQSLNNAWLAFAFHVHHPDKQRLETLLDRAKYLN